MQLKTILFFLLFFFYCLVTSAQTQEKCHEIIVEAIACMYDDHHAESLELLTKAKTWAKEHHWPKELFFALNNIGINYYQMLDYGEALNNYFEAYKIALKELDESYEMIVLNNIAVLYHKKGQLDKSEMYIEKAYNIASKRRDSIKIGRYAVNIASFAVEKGQAEKAKKFIDIAFSNLPSASKYRLEAELTRAEYLILQERYLEAEDIIRTVLPHLQTSEFIDNNISAYLLLAAIYRKKENTEKAISFLITAKNHPRASVENKIKIYNKLSSRYRESDRINLAFLYKDSVLIAKDSLNLIKNEQLFENSRIKFELRNYQRQLVASKQKLHAERETFYGIIGGIFCLIILSFWAIRNYYIKLKQTKIIVDNERKITQLKLKKEKDNRLLLEQELKQEKALAQLEEERLKNKLENKNRKLASKALSIAARNELIENVVAKLMQLSEISRNKMIEERVFALREQLKKQSEWDDYFTHFEEVNRGFLIKLKEKHPQLTSKDVRYLCYVYMNLDIKEIASLFNITPEACRKRKERIKNKMDLENETSIYGYISRI